MTIFTFHLAELPPATTARALWKAPSAPGLRYAESLALMQLGASTISPSRMQLRRMAMFARWDDEAALDAFLADDPLGAGLATGWHVRLQFLRRWSRLAALPDLPARADDWDPAEPVVAVTLARMRLLEVPRFLKWGKPVERLVRDHPATTLALAAMRPPRTISTFSIWHSIEQMEAMVHGHSPVPDPTRHATAMTERRRRDFHHEFATLRFRPLAEHGTWQGRSTYLP
ncbi:hypothetical protein HPO96_09425 [Kribbella sandramycini]|uniref:Spheroidene monooxygenase n=1 Tax=Kribbella sandramycini TaxID=60450 RepID=A0A7Y4KXI6_9ACTN|nr:hypothetical protein [Kribbella sandramycini]MBB6569706.1 hypothetical protein [Kribbella sandramycini]NOL40464.1 hypothetical protein [Kribbella sandramycini]